MRVLLVEPDKFIAESVVNGLDKHGYNVVYKKDAQSALDALDDQIPDVIILEIQLGLHNGIEFLYEIRSYTEWQNIPVIVHTINSKALDAKYSDAFRELKVAEVMYKPKTKISELVRAVMHIMSTA